MVISTGYTLDSGFPLAPPSASTQPHPFVPHDVSEDDWLWFLADDQKVGKLSPMNKIVAAVVPMALGIGLPVPLGVGFRTLWLTMDAYKACSCLAALRLV